MIFSQKHVGSSILKLFYVIEYVIIEDSAMSCDFVRSVSECEVAAQALGLADITADYDNQYGSRNDPPFCYFEYGSLKFNYRGTNTGSCAGKCLCRDNEFCVEYPCGEGKGDCDNDTECEGSLVCGHSNCMNNTYAADCCTKPCSNDSDCAISGECNTENNQCYLWPECSQDSPCADGEGDCDHHTDCEGTLLCGNDRCLSGPTSMDCCTGKFYGQ